MILSTVIPRSKHRNRHHREKRRGEMVDFFLIHHRRDVKIHFTTALILASRQIV